MKVHWSTDILNSPSGTEVYGPTGDLVFRGLRARVGIYQGEVTRIIPHRATGRADYFGPPVNRAARLLSASAPGQILLERSLVDEVVEYWQQRQETWEDTWRNVRRCQDGDMPCFWWGGVASVLLGRGGGALTAVVAVLVGSSADA